MLAGASLVLSILAIVGSERKLLRCGSKSDFIREGGCHFMQVRISEKAHWGSKPLLGPVGKSDMVGV